MVIMAHLKRANVLNRLRKIDLTTLAIFMSLLLLTINVGYLHDATNNGATHTDDHFVITDLQESTEEDEDDTNPSPNTIFSALQAPYAPKVLSAVGVFDGAGPNYKKILLTTNLRL